MVIRNPNLEKEALIEHLTTRLVVLTKEHPKTKELVIDQLALSAEPDGMRRSISVATALRNANKKPGDSIISTVSQKDIARNRANRTNRETNSNSVSIKSSLNS